jgi:hypothetical protein
MKWHSDKDTQEDVENAVLRIEMKLEQEDGESGVRVRRALVNSYMTEIHQGKRLALI